MLNADNQYSSSNSYNSTHQYPNNPYKNNYQYNPNNPPEFFMNYSSSGRRFLSHLGRILVFLVLATVLSVGASIYLVHNPDAFPQFIVQQSLVQILCLAVLLVMIGLIFSPKVFRHFLPGKAIIVIMTLMLTACTVGGSYWSIFVNPYVGMTRTGFTRASLSINNGDSEYFQNPSNGVTQTICTGINQKCQPEYGAPDELNHGIQIQPGQRIEIVFDTVGDYHITSKNTPAANLSIHVVVNTDE